MIICAAGVIFLVTIGAVGRIVLQDIPNFETIMVVTFIAAVYIREWYALLVPLAALGISDLFLGNFDLSSKYSMIMVFTYTGFLMVALVSRHFRTYFRKNSSQLDKVSIANTSMFGLTFVAIFDMWTNLGAFLLMYPHTPHGLMLCYTMAVPFMLYHLISGVATFTLVVAPVSYVMTRNHLFDDPAPSPVTQ